MGSNQSDSKQDKLKLEQYLQSQAYQQQINQVYQNSNQQELQVNQNPDEYDFLDYGYQNVGMQAMGTSQRVPMAKVQQESLTVQKNEIYIHKKSIQMVKSQTPMKQYLSFHYSTTQSAQISVFFLAKENQQDLVVTSQLPYEQQTVFQVAPTADGEFPKNTCLIDLNLLSPKDLKYCNSIDWYYPLILKISNLDNSFSFSHFCQLQVDSIEQPIKVICIMTRLIINGQVFITKDVFGINDTVLGTKNEADKQPCIVCLTNLVDTIISPCQHTVLCRDCCENMRQRNQKCPICRHIIEEYVILNKSQQIQLNDQQQQQQQQQGQSIVQQYQQQQQAEQQQQQQQQYQKPQPTNQYFQGTGHQIG